MENKEINNKILGIWKQYTEERGKYWPLLYPDFKKDAILFVGLNPSGNREDPNFDKEYRIYSEDDLKDEGKINEFIKKERESMWGKDYYKTYFRPIRNLCKDMFQDETKFNHIDLFYYREKNSEEFTKKIELNIDTKNKNVILSQFGQDQLDLFEDLLRLINPSLIIVINADSSKIIKIKFKDKLNPECDSKLMNQENCHHTISINGANIPIFFSGMLSGGHLDNDSLIRLKWHIKKAIDKIRRIK